MMWRAAKAPLPLTSAEGAFYYSVERGVAEIIIGLASSFSSFADLSLEIRGSLIHTCIESSAQSIQHQTLV